MFKSLRLSAYGPMSRCTANLAAAACVLYGQERGEMRRVLWYSAGGLLAVMCVCLLKAVLIYIYIHRQWTSLRFPKLLCCQ
jgi:hypothetical protein